ncbi:MAG: hypothetical protein ABSB23_13800 [Bryobacteraceae bacterium]|jgi:hypothetical protein
MTRLFDPVRRESECEDEEEMELAGLERALDHARSDIRALSATSYAIARTAPDARKCASGAAARGRRPKARLVLRGSRANSPWSSQAP